MNNRKDNKKAVKVYPCKTLLYRLKEIGHTFACRLRPMFPQDYEDVCFLCEQNRMAKEWRYRAGEGHLRENVIRIGLKESPNYREKKGVVWATKNPFSLTLDRSEDKTQACYLLTKARVLNDKVDLLKELSRGGYHILPFTTAGLNGVVRILESLCPPSSISPMNLLDMEIEKGSLLVPITKHSSEERCVIRRAARRGKEIIAVKEPLLEEVLVITEGEEATLFIQGIETERDSSPKEFRWWSEEEEFLGQGRYFDLSSLKTGIHQLTCHIVGASGLSDVAVLSVFVRPNPKTEPDSFFVRTKKQDVSPKIGLQFDIFLDLSQKVGLYSGREGIERFYRVTRRVGEAEVQLKVRLIGRYLKQGSQIFGLNPDALNSFFLAIEGLGNIDSQYIAKLFKAIARLLERDGEDEGSTKKRREGVTHLLESVNRFVDNGFSEENLNDLFGRVPFESSDHSWLGNLYAKRGLYESALQEIKLGGKEEGRNLFDNEEFFWQKFNQELIKITPSPKGQRCLKEPKKNSDHAVMIEVFNAKTGKYEGFPAKLRSKGKDGYIIIPPRLSGDFFDEDGHLRLRLSKDRI